MLKNEPFHFIWLIIVTVAAIMVYYQIQSGTPETLTMQLDIIDRALLQYLQEDARLTNVELARRVDLSPPGLNKRLRRLEEAGIITRYVTLIDREAVGFDMLCFVQVTLQRHEPDAVASFKCAVQKMPEVLECHHITGEFDYLLKVVVRNRKHLEAFIVGTLTPVRGMDKIRTSLVLSEIKATTVLALMEDGLVSSDR
jgi:DNA-binding Lrp family transcriptional regulator